MIAFVCLSWSIKPQCSQFAQVWDMQHCFFAFSFCRNTGLQSFSLILEEKIKGKKKKENLLLYIEMWLSIFSDLHSVTRSYPALGFCWKNLQHPFFTNPETLPSLHQRRGAGSCTTHPVIWRVCSFSTLPCWAIFSLKVFPKPALCPAARQSRSENKLLFMRTVLLTLTLLLSKTLIKLQTGNMPLAEQPVILLSPKWLNIVILSQTGQIHSPAALLNHRVGKQVEGRGNCCSEISSYYIWSPCQHAILAY